MKVLIIGGFLGSGKTRLLTHIIRYLKQKLPPVPNNVVIIENEIGAAGVDDQTLSTAGYQIEKMFSGCACCSLSGQLIASLNRLEEDLQPEYILLEATGMATPANIKSSIEEHSEWEVKVLCIVDAKRWKKLSGCLVSELLYNQLSGADIIIINKIDLCDSKQIEDTVRSVKNYNTTANMIQLSAAEEKMDDSILDMIVEVE